MKLCSKLLNACDLRTTNKNRVHVKFADINKKKKRSFTPLEKPSGVDTYIKLFIRRVKTLSQHGA